MIKLIVCDNHKNVSIKYTAQAHVVVETDDFGRPVLWKNKVNGEKGTTTWGYIEKLMGVLT